MFCKNVWSGPNPRSALYLGTCRSRQSGLTVNQVGIALRWCESISRHRLRFLSWPFMFVLQIPLGLRAMAQSRPFFIPFSRTHAIQKSRQPPFLLIFSGGIFFSLRLWYNKGAENSFFIWVYFQIQGESVGQSADFSLRLWYNIYVDWYFIWQCSFNHFQRAVLRGGFSFPHFDTGIVIHRGHRT